MKRRIPQIDGLRAIAILLVISFHYINNQLINSTDKIGKLFAFIFSFGWTGVDLFFVLSGFLIGAILLENKNKNNYFKSFYIRRLVKILPNYYLLLLVFLILRFSTLFNSDYFLMGNQVYPIYHYFTMTHNLMMAKLNNMGPPSLSITWSIGIEEQFYLIIPFLIKFVKNKHIPLLIILIILVAIIFRFFKVEDGVWIPAYVLLPCRMDALALGVLIAWIEKNIGIKLFVNKYFKHLIFAIFLIISFCIIMYTTFGDLGVIRNTLFALFFSITLLIALAREKSFFAIFLSNRLFVWIGKISYSLYLFHYLILGLTNNISVRFFELTTLIIFFNTIIALLISFTTSYLIYKYFETPIIKLGKRINFSDK